MKKLLPLLLSLGFAAFAGAAEPAQLELARKVIQASQFERIFDQMGGQIEQMSVQTLNLSNPNLTPEQKARASEVMGKVMAVTNESIKGLLTQLDGVYAEVYSEAELKAMLAFFESPEGQSMLNKQPMIMQRLMPLAQAMQRDLMPKVDSIIKAAKAADAVANPAGAFPTPVVPPAPTNAKAEPAAAK